MQRQFSLMSQRSSRSQRSLPPTSQGDSSKAKEVQSGKPAPQAGEPKDKGKGQQQNAESANSAGNPAANSAGKGTPLSQVAKSAFEGWNSQGQPGGSAKSDLVSCQDPKQTLPVT